MSVPEAGRGHAHLVQGRKFTDSACYGGAGTGRGVQVGACDRVKVVATQRLVDPALCSPLLDPGAGVWKARCLLLARADGCAVEGPAVVQEPWNGEKLDCG